MDDSKKLRNFLNGKTSADLKNTSMNTILDFIKKNLFKIILSVGVVILVMTNMRQCNNADIERKKRQVAEQNIAALNDTIRLTKTKDNKPEADKFAFLSDKVDNLAKLNRDLYNEVKNTKGSVNTIIKGDVKIVHDTVPLVVRGHLIDSIVTADFDFSKTYSAGNSRALTGFTKYDLRDGKSSGKLTKDETHMSFTTGIKDLDKGHPTIFLRSDYPGFSVDSLQGAVLDKDLFQPKNKQHLITVGLSVGWVPFTYDILTSKPSVSFTRVGVSAGVNINLSRLLHLKK